MGLQASREAFLFHLHTHHAPDTEIKSCCHATRHDGLAWPPGGARQLLVRLPSPHARSVPNRLLISAIRMRLCFFSAPEMILSAIRIGRLRWYGWCPAEHFTKLSPKLCDSAGPELWFMLTPIRVTPVGARSSRSLKRSRSEGRSQREDGQQSARPIRRLFFA